MNEITELLPEDASVEELVGNYPEVEKYHQKNVRAYLLLEKKAITREELSAAGYGSKAGIYRAGKSLKLGFKPGESGRRQKLNDEDESILENWVVDLLSEDQTIYSDTLMKMVCIIHSFPFLNLAYSGELSSREIS